MNHDFTGEPGPAQLLEPRQETNLPACPAQNGLEFDSVLHPHHLLLDPDLSFSLPSKQNHNILRQSSTFIEVAKQRGGFSCDAILPFSFLCRPPASRGSSLYPFSSSSSSPLACRSRLTARRKQCPDWSFPSLLHCQTLLARASAAFLRTLQAVNVVEVSDSSSIIDGSMTRQAADGALQTIATQIS